MVNIDISKMTDKELKDYVESVLRGRVILDVLHDETPSYKVFSLYQYQKDASQQERISHIIHSILVDNFVQRTTEKLDKESDELLGNLAFLADSLKITESYNIFRSLLDRGKFGSGTYFFYEKDTERKVLRALMTLQSPRLLVEDIWRLYWEAEDPFFADIAFLGLRRSNPRQAIPLLQEAYRRWEKDSGSFDFPEALFGMVRAIEDNETLAEIGRVLGEIPPQQSLRLEAILKAKGTPTNRISAVLIPNTYSLNGSSISRDKPFYIYYHRDLDGIGSAVLWSLILARKYKHDLALIETIPVDFDMKSEWTQKALERRPAAVLDFLYHKDATVYYCHHDHDRELPKDFKSDRQSRLEKKEKYVRLEEKGSSVISMIFSDFRDFFKSEFADRFETIDAMVEQIDRIDGAKFDTGAWWRCDSEFEAINLLLLHNRTEDFCNKLVRDLIQTDFHDLLSRDDYKGLLAKAESEIHAMLDARPKIESILETRDGVVLYDSVKHKIPFYRFLPYEIYPTANFVVGIYSKKEAFEVSVGQNPWKEPPFDIHVGQICKNFGGGGRKEVGGITVSTHEQACDISVKVIAILKSLLESPGLVAMPREVASIMGDIFFVEKGRQLREATEILSELNSRARTARDKLKEKAELSGTWPLDLETVIGTVDKLLSSNEFQDMVRNETLQVAEYIRVSLEEIRGELDEYMCQEDIYGISDPLRWVREIVGKLERVAQGWSTIKCHAASGIQPMEPGVEAKAKPKFVELRHATDVVLADEEGREYNWNAWHFLFEPDAPDAQAMVVDWILQLIEITRWQFDTICSMSVTALPIANLLAVRLAEREQEAGPSKVKPLIVQDNKTGNFLPRYPSQGETILTIDHLIQSGKHQKKILTDIKKAGAKHAGTIVLAVNDMMPGKIHKLASTVQQLLKERKVIYLYRLSELLELAKKP